jgi:predicted transposase/invertase (TIGR01784 family)
MLTQEWNWGKALEVTKKEAWEDGRMKEKLEIARNLRAEGMGVDAIARTTGLTVDDILRL